MKKEEILEFLSERKEKKLPDMQEIATGMNLDVRETSEMIALINNMERTGEIIITKKKRIALPEDMGYLRGKVQLNPRGFGFLILDSEKDKKTRNDIFLPPGSLNGAMNGDSVLVRLSDNTPYWKSEKEGEVVRIIKRNVTTLIGTYSNNRFSGIVVPDDKRIRDVIYIPEDEALSAKNGDVVVVEITRYPNENVRGEGKVISVLGRKGDPGVDMLAIFAKYNLPQEFPEKVMDYVSRIGDEISPEEISGRRDLRNQKIITIDGADAKDLDDAVTVRKLENGNFYLGVHIADVSNYVKEGSILDEEALKRATSVYLIDTVIPMLPQKLSNNLCSLNPGTEKLTLSCEMEINPEGKVVNHDIYESVIKTVHRMTYDDVTRILRDKDEKLIEKYSDIHEMLEEMEELYEILNKKRVKRGSIDFDFPESFIELNENGEPVDVRLYERAVSNRIIEEFMLCANETVAEHMYWTRMPFVYRVHEDPDPEKLEMFAQYASNLGFPLRIGRNIEPKHLQGVLDAVKGTEGEKVLSKLLLRSMMQARYSPSSLGHFGLAAEYYCHFTSPIRRYPDLQIHRIIKKFIKGEMTKTEIDRYTDRVDKVSMISSDMERVADAAEREVDDMKKTEYMHAHLGEEFKGVISSVTAFGFFVELPDTIEGLVHISELDPGLEYDDQHMKLVSVFDDTEFRLGMGVSVTVASADIDNREINFTFNGFTDESGNTIEREKEPRETLVIGGYSGYHKKQKSFGKEKPSDLRGLRHRGSRKKSESSSGGSKKHSAKGKSRKRQRY